MLDEGAADIAGAVADGIQRGALDVLRTHTVFRRLQDGLWNMWLKDDDSADPQEPQDAQHLQAAGTST